MSLTLKTADLVDEFDADVHFCDLAFLKFGQKDAFHGPIQTVKCFEDNVLLKAELQKPGKGRVLIVDAGSSKRVAVMGDMIADIFLSNDWSGIVINGSIRDSREIDNMEIGVRCLATTPKKSAKEGVGRVGVRISFGGVQFEPGDYVYCDADGLLVSKKKLY